ALLGPELAHSGPKPNAAACPQPGKAEDAALIGRPVGRFAYRNLWNFRRALAGSFGPRTGEFNHAGPFLGFVGDQLTEIAGRARKHFAANINKSRLHLDISKSGVNFSV